MPHIPLPEIIPTDKGREAWNELIAEIKQSPLLLDLPDGLKFTEIRNRDISNLSEEESPLLCVVRIGGDIDRATISPVQHEVWDKFGLRVYVYDDETDTPHVQEARDYLTEQVAKVLRKESVTKRRGPGWYLSQFSENSITYHKVGNRVFATIRFQTKKRLNPGE